MRLPLIPFECLLFLLRFFSNILKIFHGHWKPVQFHQENIPGTSQRRIQNPVKYLKWSFLTSYFRKKVYLQKQPFRGVPRKRYSENKQQIWRCSNADLAISLFVLIHIKVIPWKFRILNPKNSELFSRKICIFLKK